MSLLYNGARTLDQLWQELDDGQDDPLKIDSREKLEVFLRLNINLTEDVSLVDGRYQLTESGRAFVERQAGIMGISLKRVPGFAGLAPKVMIVLLYLYGGALEASEISNMITKCLAGTGKEVSRAEVLERLKPAIEAGFVEPLYQKRGDTRYQLSAKGRVATQEWAAECQAQGLVSA